MPSVRKILPPAFRFDLPIDKIVGLSVGESGENVGTFVGVVLIGDRDGTELGRVVGVLVGTRVGL